MEFEKVLEQIGQIGILPVVKLRRGSRRRLWQNAL